MNFSMDPISAVLLCAIAVQLVLLLTKYKQNPVLRLTLFGTMFLSTVWRIILSFQRGYGLAWFDGFAMAFFGAGTVMEVIAFVKARRGRG